MTFYKFQRLEKVVNIDFLGRTSVSIENRYQGVQNLYKQVDTRND